MFINLYRL